MEVDRQARLLNQDRLRRLSLQQAKDVRIFCAHDAVEFDLLCAADAERTAASVQDIDASIAGGFIAGGVELGTSSCSERVCHSVYISVFSFSLKNIFFF